MKSIIRKTDVRKVVDSLDRTLKIIDKLYISRGMTSDELKYWKGLYNRLLRELTRIVNSYRLIRY